MPARFPFATLLFSALFLPFAAPTAEAEVAASESATIALPAISVFEVQPVSVRDRVIANGIVTPVEEVQVQPLLSGQAIEELLADIGDSVTEGQVLARLSGSTLDLQRSEFMASRASVVAAIAQAEAGLIEATTGADEALRTATRNRALREQGTIAQAALDQSVAGADAATARVHVAEQGVASARAQLALVDAQIATLELQVARTEVRSPVGGIVTARNAMIGAIAAGGGAPMFTLIRDGALELRAEVAEEHLLRLVPGQRVTMTTIGASTPIHGTVRLVAPTIDLGTRLGEARISIDDSTLVRTGMFLSAEILVNASETLAVPITAIGTGPQGSVVMRVNDDIVAQVAVTTGARDGEMIAITSGLEAGDTIVLRAGAFLRDGDRINPVRTDAANHPQEQAQ